MPNNKDFVVISDFHSMKYPYLKMKYFYLFEYDDIYILGDVTDRGEKNDGTGGLNILINIMKLDKGINSLPDEIRKKYHIGNIHYIPGNHDKFVYDYGLKRNFKDELRMKINGGAQTIKDINHLRTNNKELLGELIDWLGSRPLQVKHFGIDKQTYCICHAFFDEKLYQKNQNYTLASFIGANHILKYELENILWFRKYEDNRTSYYSKSRVPSSDNIIVIGHTPSTVYDKDKYNLIGSDNKEVKVMCVDGGVSFDLPMLKYDGGSQVVMSSSFNEDEIYKGNYPYYSIDNILKSYLPIQDNVTNSVPEINQETYYYYLRKMIKDTNDLLQDNYVVFKDNILESLYQVIMTNPNYQKLYLSYELFSELIIYNSIFLLLSKIYQLNNYDEIKTISELKYWLESSSFDSNYPKTINHISEIITPNLIAEYLYDDEFKEISDFVLKYKGDYNKNYNINNYPIILSKNIIEFIKNIYQEDTIIYDRFRHILSKKKQFS